MEKINTEEVWKDIHGFEGLYQVSNMGRIKHLKGYNHKEDFILSPTINSKGYLYVSLSKNSSVKKYFIHRLVAINFIENTNHYEEVDHINGIRNDNRLKNLRWCSRKQNCNFPLYKYNSSKEGCWMYKRYLDLHPRARKICQYDMKGSFIAIWNTAKEAEIETKIKRSGICQSCKGKRKSAGGYIWKYYDE